MEFLTEIIIGVGIAALLGVLGFGVKRLKDWLDLDPDGQAVNTLEKMEKLAANWVINQASNLNADLSIPETRYEFVNEAVERLMKKIPKIMEFLHYDKQDLMDDVELIVKKILEKTI